MYKLSLLSVTLLFIFCCNLRGQLVPVDNNKNDGNDGCGADWRLVFQEDFDGDAVDQSEWNMYNGRGHVGNGWRRPEAFTVENGLLVVTAQMKQKPLGNGRDTTVLVSGGMAHRRTYTHGRFEFRVRTEPCPDNATSGVVLTWPRSERWPRDGELDIYETMTNTPRNPFYTVVHFVKDEKHEQIQFRHHIDGTQWHIVMLEWVEDAIRIFINGEVAWELTEPAEAIPQTAHKLCIQLDAFKHQMNGTVRMYVDWVKIYQKVVE